MNILKFILLISILNLVCSCKAIAEVMASNQYMRKLAEKTETARTISGNAKFKFNDEDGVEDFKVQEALFAMTIAQVKQVAKAVNLPGRASMKKTELVYALENFPGVEDAIITASIGDVETRISDVDEKHDKYSHKVEGKNRNVLKLTLAEGGVSFDAVCFSDPEGHPVPGQKLLHVAAGPGHANGLLLRLRR